MVSLKQSLKNKLTKKELEIMPTSFDIVGEIAIFSEFPPQLKKKENLIAKTLLKLHKNVKTVTKKIGEHKGIYRTPKIKVMGGKKTKETTYKENNVKLKLNIETCYFSARLATERLRIAKQVKQGEEILVMFSGVAPYPTVIAKNSQPKKVYGIELNTKAHKFGEENVRINKLNNVKLYKGNVKKVIPKILEERKPLIGLKSHWSKTQLEKRIKQNPKLIELFIGEGDLENKLKELTKTIIWLKKKKIKIMLHQPEEKFNKKFIELGKKEDAKNSLECYKILHKLCSKHKLEGFVIHPYLFRSGKFDKETFINNILRLKKECSGLEKFLYLENLVNHFSNVEEIQEIIDRVGINNVCIDIPHVFIEVKKDHKAFQHFIKNLRAKKYFHIADSDGRRRLVGGDGLVIGKAGIDFEKIREYIKFGVIEVGNKNEKKPVETIKSYKKFLNLIEGVEKFDRILMPLPKSAETFLPDALRAAKKGATIHFYDIVHESEIPKVSIKKIRKHYKKAKILGAVKCGQYSPRKYRICIDFQT